MLRGLPQLTNSPTDAATATACGEVQGRGGEDELGTELHSQECPISKPAVKQNFTPIIT